MKASQLRTLLALALLVLGGTADAVTLARNGIGQALIYPYYTVNNSQDTLISVVNPTSVGKAIQVRFLEGYDGRDVFDLVLFLAEHDVWTASISQVAYDGGALLRTSDTSCTLPVIPTEGVNFISDNYDGTAGLPDDGGPHDIARTREGSINFIVGGDIVAGSATDAATLHPADFFAGTAPPDCASLDASTFADDLVAPTDGLFGTGAIVNVGVGTYVAYNADALADFTYVPLFAVGADAVPPGLDDANSSDGSPGATAHIFGADGRPIAASFDAPIDAVSAVFMADTIYNEYITAATLGANTDWIVTLPTKRFYVDPVYGSVPFGPFPAAFQAPGRATATVTATIYDREEAFSQIPFCDNSFPEANCEQPVSLDFEVNVLGFGQEPPFTPYTSGTPSGVLGSVLTPFQIRSFGDDGAAVMDLSSGDGGHGLFDGTDANGAAISLLGLPVDGFMAYDIINTQAQPGLLANYGGGFSHRATVSCAGPGDECGLPNTQAPH